MGRRIRALVIVAGAAAAAAVGSVLPVAAQIVDPLTTTTAAPADGTPPAEQPEPGSPDFEDSSNAPDGATDDGGEGVEVPAGSHSIPADAQAIINSVPRSRPNSSADLYDAVQELVALGLSEDEAIRIGFGRFPVAGVANFVHDWLYPRWGPGFRFHLGTDVFAAYGTPLRAPVDGVATSNQGGLGGLTVKVVMADGTEFYFAHLSALPEGFVDGAPVRTGDIVGYVGDSGNARGGSPHLHFGIYPRGGGAVDPKPVLDKMLADAMEALPATIEAVRANLADAAERVARPRRTRTALAGELLGPVLAARVGAGDPSVVDYESAANAASGGLALAAEQARVLSSRVDWGAQSDRARLRRAGATRLDQAVRGALGPLASVIRTSSERASG